eukprot:2312411-Pleurochrysis_carterae.AAC.2
MACNVLTQKSRARAIRRGKYRMRGQSKIKSKMAIRGGGRGGELIEPRLLVGGKECVWGVAFLLFTPRVYYRWRAPAAARSRKRRISSKSAELDASPDMRTRARALVTPAVGNRGRATQGETSRSGAASSAAAFDAVGRRARAREQHTDGADTQGCSTEMESKAQMCLRHTKSGPCR